MPPGVIANVASFSGISGLMGNTESVKREGEWVLTDLSYILAIRISPRPFLRLILVVEACASIWPPIGFFGSA